MKIAVFVSGRGSNLQAILESQRQSEKYEVSAVVSDKFNCGAFEIAKNFSIKTYTVGNKEGCISFHDLSKLFLERRVELIVLAGFLKLLPTEFVDQFKNKIINIHPALLPSFGGIGMYGLNVHKAVFDSSARVSGASVHYVDSTYDTGKIIAQRCVDISDVKSPEEIAERVLKIEHQILPYVIGKFADGKIKIVDNRVIIFD